MSSYQQITRKIGDQWVAALKRAEEAAASTAGSIRGKVDLPQIPVPEKLNQLSKAVTKHLPPGEIVQANFELTERLLAAQRDLALRLIGATDSRNRAAAPRGPQKMPVAKKATSTTK